MIHGLGPFRTILSRPLLLAASLLLTGKLTAQQYPSAWQITDKSSSAGSLLNYTRQLTAKQKATAIKNGWEYTIVFRLLDDFGAASPSMFIIFGHGSRRFLAAWDLNSEGALTAIVGGANQPSYPLTTGGAESTGYHTHQLIYDPDTKQTIYRFDGTEITRTDGIPESFQDGIVQWGSSSSNGQGSMNIHSATFRVNGVGTVAAYHAGTREQSSGDPAPNPTEQNWIRFPEALLIGVEETGIAPDDQRVPDTTPRRWTVTNLEDSGIGSLREAIANANAQTVGNSVIDLTGVSGVIELKSTLTISSNVIFEGPGANQLAISGNEDSTVYYGVPIFQITNGRFAVRFQGVMIRNGGSEQGSIGGIYSSSSGSLTLSRCIVTRNRVNGGSGGGIWNRGTGTLIVVDSSISQNRAYTGGGIANEEGKTFVIRSSLERNSAGFGRGGGAIANYAMGSLTIIDSTLSNNSAGNGGGAIYNAGELRIANTTLSGNTAGTGSGGALLNGGRATISNATIVGNTASLGGGGGLAYLEMAGAGIRVSNSIVAGNEEEWSRTGQRWPSDVSGPGFVSTGSNFVGEDLSEGHVFSGDLSFSNTTAETLSDLVDVLADNGGPTRTHNLVLGSPAINAGTENADWESEYDQRSDGFLRVTGPRIDLGALETNQPPLDFTTDRDGDGASDGHEEIAGTDPDDGTSQPGISSIGLSSPTHALVSLQSVFGRTYHLEHSSDFKAWTQVESKEGTGAVLEFRPLRGADPRNYFRLRISR